MMVNPSKEQLKLSDEVAKWRVLTPRTDEICYVFKKNTPKEIKDKWELGKKLYGWKDWKVENRLGGFLLGGEHGKRWLWCCAI